MAEKEIVTIDDLMGEMNSAEHYQVQGLYDEYIEPVAIEYLKDKKLLINEEFIKIAVNKAIEAAYDHFHIYGHKAMANVIEEYLDLYVV